MHTIDKYFWAGIAGKPFPSDEPKNDDHVSTDHDELADADGQGDTADER